MTAAHCFSNKTNIKLSFVRLGHSNLHNEEAFDVKVESIVVHPEFKIKPFPVNDIAILKLSTKIDINDKVTPICLPEVIPINQNVIFYPLNLLIMTH